MKISSSVKPLLSENAFYLIAIALLLKKEKPVAIKNILQPPSGIEVKRNIPYCLAGQQSIS